MAKLKNIKDSAPQRVLMTLAMTAANTRITQQIPFSASIHTPNSQAVEIIDVMYGWDSGVLQQDFFDGHGDLEMFLSMAAVPSAFNLSAWSIIGAHRLYVNEVGAIAAGYSVVTQPYPQSLVLPPKDLEGRGVILPPDNLYIIIDTSGMTIPGLFHVVVYYRVHDVDERMALEMMQMINALQ